MSAYTTADSDGWHVVPMDDLRPHSSSRDCWCKPRQDEEESTVWIHHSLDGREHTKEKGITQ